MIGYRSTCRQSGLDYSNTYRVQLDGVWQKGSCAYVSDSLFDVQYNNYVIGNNVTSCRGMFLGSKNNFENVSITIPESVEDCSYMFSNCVNINKFYIMPNSVLNCSYMYLKCSNFNQPITLPLNVKNTSFMFSLCNNLTHYCELPLSINDCSGMYRYCSNLKIQTVVIPNTVMNCSEMFNYVDVGNIYFKGNEYRNINIRQMLGFHNATNRTNIFFNIVLNNIFNIVQSVKYVASWTPMENGFYSASDNIYCYYNYSGV